MGKKKRQPIAKRISFTGYGLAGWTAVAPKPSPNATNNGSESRSVKQWILRGNYWTCTGSVRLCSTVVLGVVLELAYSIPTISICPLCTL